jgi:hypothetical protein
LSIIILVNYYPWQVMRISADRIVRLSFILLISAGLKTAEGQYHWSGSLSVSEGSNPDMVIDRKTGNLHIVSMKNGVVYVKKDSIGQDLIRETIPGTEKDIGEFHFGASVAVDMDGNPHVCFREYRSDTDTYDLYYTWRDTIDWLLPFKLSQKVPRGYVVRMAVDGQNRVHIAQSSESEKFLTPWGDVTYYRVVHGIRDKTQMITNPDQTSYRVDNRFELDATESGIVHIVIGDPESIQGPVLYYRSNNGGDTWNFISDIHSTETNHRNGNPDIFLDLSGNTHFCYGASSDLSVGGTPSVRYVRYKGNWLVQNIPVTEQGELLSWHGGEGWGLGSVAATDNGKYVAVAYLTKDIGELYTRISSDAGITWSDPILLAYSAGNYEGRSMQVIRAYRNHFYIVYPSNYSPVGTALRFLRNVGDLPPVAVSGGPYSGTEGTPLLLDMSASTDTGENAGIIEYAWNWDGDSLYDFVTNYSSAYTTFTDDFNGEVMLRVTDRIGQSAYTKTWVTIENVPPTVYCGADTTCNEGDTLFFSAQVTDMGSEDTHSILWDFGDIQFEDVLETEYVFPNDSLYSVYITVTDKDGGIGKDTVAISVFNVSPIAEAGGPYHAVPLDTVYFTGSAWDPGIKDSLSFSWDLDDDFIFEASGQNVSGVFQNNGLYRIWLKVMDEDGGIGYDSAQVIISNGAPVIGTIPDQIVLEGEFFQPLDLDDYVEDPEQGDDELTWSCSGNTDLILTLENRILTVTVPDSEWFGEESIKLVVRDPLMCKDSTEVTFIVQPVNDPPFWSAQPDTQFLEDDTLRIPLSALQSKVTDVDDTPENLQFSISDNTNIQWLYNSARQTFDLYAAPNWNGRETLFFIVTDTSGAANEIQSSIKVNPDPDPPNFFTLISPRDTTFTEWPDSMRFRWHSTSDPDSGDGIYYIWTLSNPGGSSGPITRTSNPLQDTVYLFLPDSSLEEGIYLWWVTAFDLLGHPRETNPRGIFVGVTDVETPWEETPPAEFALFQNYPNPFNPETRITYCLPKESEIRLAVYNTLGQKVRILEEGRSSAGVHTVLWDGRDSGGARVMSGIYLCRLEAGGKVFYRKMMLIQ